MIFLFTFFHRLSQSPRFARIRSHDGSGSCARFEMPWQKCAICAVNKKQTNLTKLTGPIITLLSEENDADECLVCKPCARGEKWVS